MGSLARNWGFGAFLWLLLATVLMLAFDPFGPAVHETSGSPFSFFTRDVSLGPSRAPAPEKATAELRANPPPGPAPAMALVAAALAVLAPSALIAGRPILFQTEPFIPKPRTRGLPDVRGPPRA